jgi:hypothetical protein
MLTPTTADDLYEPNDTREQAVNLTAPIEFSAILCPGDEDWYAFDLIDATTLHLAFSAAQGDIDIVLYDESGDAVGGARSGDDDEELDLAPFVQGAYSVQVSHYEDTSACQPYELAID